MNFKGLGYDKNGNRVSQSNPNGTTLSYEYDSCSRFTKETVKSREGGEHTERTAYAYDAAGNRIKKLQDGDICRYEYNNLNQLTK